MTGESMKCLNVIVFYENREEIERYISEVSEIAEGMTDIVLVVNSDRDKQVPSLDKSLKEKGINCYIIADYGENVGYLNALLKTIISINIEPYDYVILSNTDIRYEMKSFFPELAKKTYGPDIGCIAPSVLSTKTGGYQNPHYRERIPREHFEKLIRIFRHPFLGKMYLKLAGLKAGTVKKGKQDSCYVYSPNGAYMIFTADFIQRMKGYEYGVLLYSEESCIGEMLLKNGMKCYYDSTIEVIHSESTVTGKIDYRKRFNAWRESMEYILRTFY